MSGGGKGFYTELPYYRSRVEFPKPENPLGSRWTKTDPSMETTHNLAAKRGQVNGATSGHGPVSTARGNVTRRVNGILIPLEKQVIDMDSARHLI